MDLLNPGRCDTGLPAADRPPCLRPEIIGLQRIFRNRGPAPHRANHRSRRPWAVRGNICVSSTLVGQVWLTWVEPRGSCHLFKATRFDVLEVIMDRFNKLRTRISACLCQRGPKFSKYSTHKRPSEHGSLRL